MEMSKEFVQLYMQCWSSMEIMKLKNHRVGSQQYLHSWAMYVLRRGGVRETKVDMDIRFKYI